MAAPGPLPDNIRVIIADDHPIFRKGIEATLKFSPGIAIVSHASNGEEVMKLLAKNPYDVIFMDIKMSPMDGIATTEKVHNNYPDVKVIALSMFDEDEMVVTMMKKGASAYLLKNADREELFTAMRYAFSGEIYYSKEISKMLQEKLNHLIIEGNLLPELDLTLPLVREVIFLLCHEFSNADIARILDRSQRTIEGYRNKIIRSTGSSNIIGVVKYGINMHILDDINLKVKFRDELENR